MDKVDASRLETLVNLRRKLLTVLPSVSIPDKLMLLDHPLPITTNGKIDRKSIAVIHESRVYHNLADLDSSHSSSVPLEIILAHLIPPADSSAVDWFFLALGGDSITASLVVSKIIKGSSQEVGEETRKRLVLCLLNESIASFLVACKEELNLSSDSVTNDGAVKRRRIIPDTNISSISSLSSSPSTSQISAHVRFKTFFEKCVDSSPMVYKR